jgi:hypothetical protein
MISQSADPGLGRVVTVEVMIPGSKPGGPFYVGLHVFLPLRLLSTTGLGHSLCVVSAFELVPSAMELKLSVAHC